MEQKEYREERLQEEQLPLDPMALFGAWYAAAKQTEPWRGSSMVLATATAACELSARVVLMRGHAADGIRFYTNYESRKGAALQARAQAAVVFWWPTQVRQVRIEGAVERLSPTENDAYFASRPRGSQVGAWSSRQSAEIESVQELRDAFAQKERKFQHTDTIPRPPDWGGYLLIPQRVEFWQGGEYRLHDRIAYTRQDGDWQKTRLSP